MTLSNIYRAQTKQFDLNEDGSSSEDDGITSESIDASHLSNLDEPLIPTRKNHKIYHVRGKVRRNSKNFTWILCFALTLVCVVALLLIFIDWVLDKTDSTINNVTNHRTQISYHNVSVLQLNIKPCSNFSSNEVWHQTIPKLMTETAIRMNDVNNDGVVDVLVGFLTVLDGYFVGGIPRKACDMYFNGTFPCFGGILALDGRTGHELWRHYTLHEVFAINCNADIDFDGIHDCLIAGRAGVFEAVSAKHGSLLWRFEKDQPGYKGIMGIYTPQFIRDLDGDSVPDILVSHGGDPLRFLKYLNVFYLSFTKLNSNTVSSIIYSNYCFTS